jgi:hypothetical protein
MGKGGDDVRVSLLEEPIPIFDGSYESTGMDVVEWMVKYPVFM